MYLHEARVGAEVHFEGERLHLLAGEAALKALGAVGPAQPLHGLRLCLRLRIRLRHQLSALLGALLLRRGLLPRLLDALVHLLRLFGVGPVRALTGRNNNPLYPSVSSSENWKCGR